MTIYYPILFMSLNPFFSSDVTLVFIIYLSIDLDGYILKPSEMKCEGYLSSYRYGLMFAAITKNPAPDRFQ